MVWEYNKSADAHSGAHTPFAKAIEARGGRYIFETEDNYRQRAQLADKIRKAVRHAGYLDAQVTPERHIDDAKKTVDVALHIDAGPQYQQYDQSAYPSSGPPGPVSTASGPIPTFLAAGRPARQPGHAG